VEKREQGEFEKNPPGMECTMEEKGKKETKNLKQSIPG